MSDEYGGISRCGSRYGATHKRTKRRRYILTMIGERYTAIHYALPMCQAIPTPDDNEI